MSEIRLERPLPGGRLLRVCKGDLTREPVDAIVNAANEHLAHGGGLAGAIVRAGGDVIQRESDAVAPVPTGGAKATGAGALPCRRVVHAVGPIYGRYAPEEADRLLASATESALAVAASEGLESVALPAISSGIFGFPKDRCARVMIATVVAFVERNPATPLREVRLCNFDEPTVAVFEAEAGRLPGP